MKQIDLSELMLAKKIATSLADQWSFIQPTDGIRDRAILLVSHFALRAADALQLAGALDWADNQPTGRIFLTADNKLREAARLSGFDTSLL